MMRVSFFNSGGGGGKEEGWRDKRKYSPRVGAALLPSLLPVLSPCLRTVYRRPVVAPSIQYGDGNGGPEKQLGRQAGIPEGEELLLEEKVGEPEDTWRWKRRDRGRGWKRL